MLEIQTAKKLTLGEEFAFKSSPKFPLKAGNVLKIKDREGNVYGKARVIEVGGRNDYIAIVVAVKL